MSEVIIADEKVAQIIFEDEMFPDVKTEDTASQLELYKEYATEEIQAGNDILNFSEFREAMNS